MLKKLAEGILKLKNKFEFYSICSIMYILLYQIPTLRKLCKSIYLYISTDVVIFDIFTVKHIYFFGEYISKIVILFYIILLLSTKTINFFWEKWLKSQEGKTRFEKSLFRYLRDNSISHCFLVSGKWGSGKTYDVNTFFDKYYKFSKAKVYRISCFGLNTRNDLVEEINKTIEQTDSSFYTTLINVLQYLPIIGEPIGKLMKKNYNYASLKKDSIFIFDDFERICSKSLLSSNDYDINIPKLYSKSPFFLREAVRTNPIKQFVDISDEFSNVQAGFNKIDKYLNSKLQHEYYEKYIAIVGLINEIIDIHNMKVLIICNTDVLGEKFVHDVLRSKLNCIEYKKIVEPNIRQSIITNIIKNRIIDDDRKHKIISQYLDEFKNILVNVNLNKKFNDLRLFSGVIEAFVHAANLFSNDELTNDFMTSLLNSIFLTHCAYYNNSYDWLIYFKNGANIKFLVNLICPYGFDFEPFTLNSSFNECKWVDLSISGYWIFNLSSPNNISSLYHEWNTYKYSESEYHLVINQDNSFSIEKYEFIHVFYHLINLGPVDKIEWNFKPYLDSVFANYDFTIEKIQEILEQMNILSKKAMPENFSNYVLEYISSKYHESNVEGDSHFHYKLNNYIDKVKNPQLQDD